MSSRDQEKTVEELVAQASYIFRALTKKNGEPEINLRRATYHAPPYGEEGTAVQWKLTLNGNFYGEGPTVRAALTACIATLRKQIKNEVRESDERTKTLSALLEEE